MTVKAILWLSLILAAEVAGMELPVEIQERLSKMCSTYEDGEVAELPPDLGYRRIAECYLYGIERDEDVEKAFEFFRKAGVEGDATGYVEASKLILLRRLAGDAEIESAVSMLRLAEEAYHPRASYLLGLLYAVGHGVPHDLEQANIKFARSLYLEYETPWLFYYLAYSTGSYGYPKDPYTSSLYLERLMSLYGEEKGPELAESLAVELADMLSLIAGDESAVKQ